MKAKKQFLSIILLGILLMGIIPVESFHAHEEPHIICKEGTKHVEAKKFECELCDFVLPLFELSASSSELVIASINTIALEYQQSPTSRDLFDIPQYRGPPLA